MEGSIDLKAEYENWDEAFNTYEFSTRDKKYMSNFNLKYECLDARDDFHAQLEKRVKKASKEARCESDTSDSESDFGIDIHCVGSDDCDIYKMLSEDSRKMLENKKEVADILRNCGWTAPCEMDRSLLDLNRYEPEIAKTANGWKSTVKECRDKIIQERQRVVANSTIVRPAADENASQYSGPGHVKIVDADYLRYNFKARFKESNCIIDVTVKNFKLNEEQERAFRIVANHAASFSPDPLKMYLGGMGGTGKSQVIKALISMFIKRNEAHRFVVVAPTGSAAALLNGSTYHSLLGIHIANNRDAGMSNCSANIINVLRAKLTGVEYIFLDEVSMVSCHELYAISARLAELTNMHDKPFGGVNMIFAGDFAQLAPVGGVALYSHVPLLNPTTSSVRQQEKMISKLLWHQITTVVILKKNMRQVTQTEADAKLRLALENMRYASCTEEDIDFLRS